MPAAKPTGGKRRRLPRGRHGLPPEAVADSQRRRIIEAMVEVVAERGYPATRVVDVIEAAGVSRKTFYELYADKEDCFLAAYDRAIGVLERETNRAYDADPGAPWPDRLRSGLIAFLSLIAAQPAAAKFCVVDVLAAGPKALARRDAAVRGFTGLIDAGRAESRRELPGITALSLAGGVNELLYSQIMHGASAHLLSRLPDLVYWITQPYLGSQRAELERERARRTLLEVPPPAAPSMGAGNGE
jgi:AcrR family transcriptional regulator